MTPLKPLGGQAGGSLKVYDIVRDIIADKTGALMDEPSFDREFSPYMVARYLSMRKEYVPFADWINIYGRVLPKTLLYRFLVRHVPRSGNGFVDYIRRKKVEVKTDEDDEISIPHK